MVHEWTFINGNKGNNHYLVESLSKSIELHEENMQLRNLNPISTGIQLPKEI